MKWSDLPGPWQVCFEEAWAGYRAGSFPIGAVVFDKDGRLLARGRNRIYDDHSASGQISLNQLAHAELNTLLQIDRRSYDLHTSTLYTSLEPCPLCMGAIYMSGIRAVYYGARDSYAGSTNLLGTTPYLTRKNVRVFGPADQQLETIFLAMQVACEIKRKNITGWQLFETVVGAWEQSVPAAVKLGQILYDGQLLENWAAEAFTPESSFEKLSEAANIILISG